MKLQTLRALILEKEPELNVRIAVYPKYETKGDLAASVEIFREWYACSISNVPKTPTFNNNSLRLQDQVTDLEQEAGTSTPILKPSVKVILLAHSAGLVNRPLLTYVYYLLTLLS